MPQIRENLVPKFSQKLLANFIPSTVPPRIVLNSLFVDQHVGLIPVKAVFEPLFVLGVLEGSLS